jgi:Domain of unknown function (DUF222)/HNH endonuclease
MAVIEDIDTERHLDLGGWLVRNRWEMDRGESTWLEALAEFDRDQGWAVDGQLSCAEWLMWRSGMGRATAYEKLRIAHELRRRPQVAEAFSAGTLSYSAVRAITRIDDPDPEVDAALIEVAKAGSIGDVERMVRVYQLHVDQHRLPPDPQNRRGVRVLRFGDGTGRLEATLTELELDEVATVLQAFFDLKGSDPGQRAVDSHPQPVDDLGDKAVDESPAGDSQLPLAACLQADTNGDADSTSLASSPRPDDQVSWPARRADALMEMARCALAHAGEGNAMGADRYLVHVVRHEGEITKLDGSPVPEAEAARLLCDHAAVQHLVGPDSEPLALGRKTREWSTSQRRAILVRDGGTCRFPGCERRIVDVHHLQPWSEGGPTDVGNGMLVCLRHHVLLHGGFRATGDANHGVAFLRPDGSLLDVSLPCRRPHRRRERRRSCASVHSGGE